MFKELNILKSFFEDPEKGFNVREIARMLKIAPATASKKLKKFSRKNLLKLNEVGNLKIYKANLDSQLYKDIKLFYNIRKIKNSGLIEKLNELYLKPTVVLFGSAFYGEDVKDSDFDFLILSETKKEFKNKEKFEKKLNRKLQLFIVEDIGNLKNKHLVNNILNGLVLQGKITWI